MPQVVIKNHGDVANQKPPFRGNFQAACFRLPFNQALRGEALQIGDFLGEIIGKIGLVIGKFQRKAAHQILDNLAAHHVISVQLIAAHHGQFALVQIGVVRIQIALVLAVCVANFADAAHANRY